MDGGGGVTQHMGTFGMTQSGKTTLVKELSRQMWLRQRRASLVLDINGENWGEHAKVFRDAEEFERVVWATRDYFVVVEEASTVIASDKEKNPLFTRIRHNGHSLCVVGHHGSNLTPQMREQIHIIHLFRVSLKSAELWADHFAQDALLQAPSLGQFEFLRYELYGPPPQKMKLKL